MKGIGKIFKNRYSGLVFSLISGCAYFVILLSLLSGYAQNTGLLLFFFAPAIICGTALVLFKTAVRLLEEGRRISLLCYSHLILIFIAVIFALEMVI